MEILHGLKKHSCEIYLNHSFILVVASTFYFDEGGFDAEFSCSGMWEGMLVTSWAFGAPGVLQFQHFSSLTRSIKKYSHL